MIAMEVDDSQLSQSTIDLTTEFCRSHGRSRSPHREVQSKTVVVAFDRMLLIMSI